MSGGRRKSGGTKTHQDDIQETIHEETQRQVEVEAEERGRPQDPGLGRTECQNLSTLTASYHPPFSACLDVISTLPCFVIRSWAASPEDVYDEVLKLSKQVTKALASSSASAATTSPEPPVEEHEPEEKDGEGVATQRGPPQQGS